MTTSLIIAPHTHSVELSRNGESWVIVVEDKPKEMSFGTWAATLTVNDKPVAYLPTVKDKHGTQYEGIELFEHLRHLLMRGVLGYDTANGGHNLIGDMHTAIQVITQKYTSDGMWIEDEYENSTRHFLQVPFSDGEWYKCFRNAEEKTAVTYSLEATVTDRGYRVIRLTKNWESWDYAIMYDPRPIKQLQSLEITLPGEIPIPSFEELSGWVKRMTPNPFEEGGW